MLHRPHRIWTSVLLFILAFLAIWISSFAEHTLDLVLLLVVGLMIAAAGLADLGYFIASNFDLLPASLEEEARASIVTPEVEQLRLISNMNSEQIALLREHYIDLITLPGPRELIRFGSEIEVPRTFVLSFFSAIENNQLPAVRWYRSSSAEFEWANKTVAGLSGLGYARRVGGPYSARLLISPIELAERFRLTELVEIFREESQELTGEHRRAAAEPEV